MDVTDSGISRFCGSDKPNVGVCFGGLEYLFVRGTSVTSSGIHCAATHLKRLKQLDCEKETRDFFRLGITRPVSRMLSFDCGSDGSLSIEKVVLISRNALLKSTRKEDKVYTNQLVTLVDLSETLRPPRHFANRRISFYLGIVPFLTTFGNPLRAIALRNFTVDIFFITYTCPLIQRIKLKYCIFCDSADSLIPLPDRNVPPSCIEELDYQGFVMPRDSSEELLHLLMSPKLVNISIMYCANLYDDVLHSAFNSHRFKHLKRLTLYSCDNVSNEAFKSIFLVDSNVLQYIKIWNCRQLSLQSVFAEWVELATKNNWDIKIVFLK